MITYILIISFISIAAGFGILVHSAIHAPVGFEDANGFHQVVISSQENFATAYSGPERRSAANRADPRPAAAVRTYAGPRRRASDFGNGQHLEMPHLGGLA
jgi:hypothetical protein